MSRFLHALVNPRMWRAIMPSVLFNLRNLPLNQAIRMPIWVYKMRLISQKGTIVIDCRHVYTGMILLGFPRAATYPNNGIVWRNYGKIVFKGECKIGNDCAVICGKKGRIEFGKAFRATAGLRLVSEYGITFGQNVLVGWGNVFIDTNFHPLYDMEKKKFKNAFSPITIGDDNWFGMNCLAMPGVTTPGHCIFGARTIVTRGGQYESYCVHGGSPVRVLSRNIMRVTDQDQVRDYSEECNEYTS